MNHVYATAMLADPCLYHCGEPCPLCQEYWTEVWARRAEEEMLMTPNQNADGFTIQSQYAVARLSLGGDLVFKSGTK